MLREAIAKMSVGSWLKFELRLFLGKYPWIFIPIAKKSRFLKDNVIQDNTDLVIDGYPRSANTFFVAAFTLAQRREVNIARHLHAPAHILSAIKKKTPVVVLVRSPQDAALSLVIRQPRFSLSQALRRYSMFYSQLYPYRNEFVIGVFDEVTQDPGKVIEKINQRFWTNFDLFVNSKPNFDKCFKLVEEMDMANTGKREVTETMVARPSSDRDKKKGELLQEVENNMKIKNLLKKADAIYNKFIE